MTFTEEATREKNATSSLSAGVTNIASAPSAADSSSSGVKRASFFLRKSSKSCLSRVSTPPKFLFGPATPVEENREESPGHCSGDSQDPESSSGYGLPQDESARYPV